MGWLKDNQAHVHAVRAAQAAEPKCTVCHGHGNVSYDPKMTAAIVVIEKTLFYSLQRRRCPACGGSGYKKDQEARERNEQDILDAVRSEGQ